VHLLPADSHARNFVVTISTKIKLLTNASISSYSNTVQLILCEQCIVTEIQWNSDEQRVSVLSRDHLIAAITTVSVQVTYHVRSSANIDGEVNVIWS
jgi:hypothetical protein